MKGTLTLRTARGMYGSDGLELVSIIIIIIRAGAAQSSGFRYG